MYTAFKDVEFGGYFHSGGNTYRKRSNSTAEIVEPSRFYGQWFYFEMQERVEPATGE